MKYRWLHISDLHSMCRGIRTITMIEALIDELKFINDQSPFSFVLITGDISDKNNGYKEAKELIYKIVETIGLGMEKVFIVPGNHDLDRNIPKDREDQIKKGWSLDLLDEQEVELIEALIPGQNDFFRAYEEILGREYPRDTIHFSDELDDNISIIHLNTAWMCFDSANESGKLHIGLNSVTKCFSEDKVKDKEIKIVIGHHRLSDFNKTVENYLRVLFKTKDIDLYLGGHCHESMALYDPSINTEFCSCRQARAEDNDYPAGFIVGDINTDDDQSSFQFYSWDGKLAKWTYDYTVSPAKHGKYYLRGEKFTKEPVGNRNVIVDLKIFGVPLDYEIIINQFNINKPAIYRSSLRQIRPKSQDEWNICFEEIESIYNNIVKDCNKCIHVFPIAPIPLLVAFGYLMQNDNPYINIYQYNENESKWVFKGSDSEIKINTCYEVNGGKKLALQLSVSSSINRRDIEEVMNEKFDCLSIGIENPILAKVNYYEDVYKLKSVIKTELDRLHSKYDEIHLFLAAPAGLCIEVGRIIRENMYPNTFIYNYVNSNTPKYSKIFNLKQLRNT
ncbi:MAG: SAVED domain-containing protein [Clostridiales bacterium]|nr:SAVED domain-containing protein [Clostridiales bacterium]